LLQLVVKQSLNVFESTALYLLAITRIDVIIYKLV